MKKREKKACCFYTKRSKKNMFNIYFDSFSILKWGWCFSESQTQFRFGLPSSSPRPSPHLLLVEILVSLISIAFTLAIIKVQQLGFRNWLAELRKPRREDLKFWTTLGYTVRSHLKEKKKRREKRDLVCCIHMLEGRQMCPSSSEAFRVYPSRQPDSQPHTLK